MPIGADGEEKVATQLAKAAKKDPRWRFLHAIPVGDRGSDIDHVIVDLKNDDYFGNEMAAVLLTLADADTLAATLKELTGGEAARHAVPPGNPYGRADELLADLGVTKTHSRPHVSDDNPFSEAQFKTLKYRPDFPARFATYEAARAFSRAAREHFARPGEW